MRIGHIELFVRDLERARRFYVDVLGAVDVQPDATHVAWVRLGAVEILLRPGGGAPQHAAYGTSGAGVVLYTEGLDETLERLRARGLLLRGQDGSPRCPTFTDPDGHWFQLVDPEEQ